MKKMEIAFNVKRALVDRFLIRSNQSAAITSKWKINLATFRNKARFLGKPSFKKKVGFNEKLAQTRGGGLVFHTSYSDFISPII